MLARQFPDRCDKCVGCNDAHVAVDPQELWKMTVVVEEVVFGNLLRLNAVLATAC
jgi:hypothetical protein